MIKTLFFKWRYVFSEVSVGFFFLMCLYNSITYFHNVSYLQMYLNISLITLSICRNVCFQNIYTLKKIYFCFSVFTPYLTNFWLDKIKIFQMISRYLKTIFISLKSVYVCLCMGMWERKYFLSLIYFYERKDENTFS